MPIDPNTGMYVDPLGTLSPGGMGSSALTVLSNMLATNLAATKRQSSELDLAKKQSDYDDEELYRQQMANVKQPFSDQSTGPWAPPEDQQEQIAIEHSSPATVLSNLYRHDYQQQNLDTRKAGIDERAKAAEDTNVERFTHNAVIAGMTNAQYAQTMAKRFPNQMSKEDADAIASGPHANEPFAPATAAKINLQNNQAALAGEKAVTQTAVREALAARVGLDKARIAYLGAQAQKVRDAVKTTGGKLKPQTMNQLRTEQRLLNLQIAKAKERMKARLGGQGGMPMTEEESKATQEEIDNAEKMLKVVDQDLSSIPVDGAGQTPPKTVQPDPNAVNTRTAVPTQSWEGYVQDLQKKSAGSQ